MLQAIAFYNKLHFCKAIFQSKYYNHTYRMLVIIKRDLTGGLRVVVGGLVRVQVEGARVLDGVHALQTRTGQTHTPHVTQT